LTDLKNVCLYNKAQALSKLNRNKEAIKILNELNYPESDSIFLSYINQEKYYIHRSKNQNKKALNDITRALCLNPREDEFLYRKAAVLFELKKYDETLIELSKIKYRDKYDLLIHDLTCIAAFKAGNLKLSKESSEYIINHKEKYDEKSINTAHTIILIIKQKSDTLSDSEEEQLRALKRKDISSEMKREIK
jgi:tetratricopeptide (TPR) repeat protein